MDKNNARCTGCGKEFFADKSLKKVTCPFCGVVTEADKAVKYYESVHENAEQMKEAHGEDYHRVRLLIDEAYDLIGGGEYEEAENRLNSALELTGLDYRVYMAFVAAKTKNYTDLKDETHKTYLNKAISVADADGKKEIKRLYKNYYIKAGLDKEQLSAYYEEEARLKKAKAEKGLKNLIPEYLVKEKRNKVFVWIFPSVFALSLAFAVLFFVYYDIWLSLISAGTAIVGYLFFRVWFVNRDKVRIFNAVLDLYDLLETTSLSGEMLVKAYDALIKLYKRFADNDPVFSIEREVESTVDLLTETGDEKIKEFIDNKLRR